MSVAIVEKLPLGPCQMTMDLRGLKLEDLVAGLDEPAGATMSLAAAYCAITLSSET